MKFNKYGQPIGKTATTLSNFLGLIARNGRVTPLQYKDWRMVPTSTKDTIWLIVQVTILNFFQIKIFFMTLY